MFVLDVNGGCFLVVFGNFFNFFCFWFCFLVVLKKRNIFPNIFRIHQIKKAKEQEGERTRRRKNKKAKLSTTNNQINQRSTHNNTQTPSTRQRLTK